MKEKTLFWQNKVALDQLEINLETGRGWIQGIVDSFAVINVPVSIEDILHMIDNRRKLQQEKLRDFLFEKLFAGEQLPAWVDKNKAKELASYPDTSGLISAFEKLESHITGPSGDFILWHCYTVKENKVHISGSAVEKQRDLYRFYAETPEQLTRLSLVESLCLSLNEIQKASTEFNVIDIKLKGICEFDESKKAWKPQPLFVMDGTCVSRFNI